MTGLYTCPCHTPCGCLGLGGEGVCAGHLCRRHRKLSYFPAPPPEGISTKLSILARLNTDCWLWWEQELSRCTVVASGRGWSIPSRRTEPCREGGVLEEQPDSSSHQHVTGPKGQNYFSLIFRETSCFITNQESIKN